jgi:hypothetical protein
MYRNIVYNNNKSVIKLFTWDEEGNRVTKNYKYLPYLYTESATKTDAKSIFGGDLKRHVFKNNFERYQFAKMGEVSRVYNNLPIEQNFLIDMFWKENKHEDFSRFDLSIFYIDIEVYSPDEFPDEWEAKHPINVITVYNSLKNEFRVFCLDKDYDPSALSQENQERYAKITDKSKVIHSCYTSEKELLVALLAYWQVEVLQRLTIRMCI